MKDEIELDSFGSFGWLTFGSVGYPCWIVFNFDLHLGQVIHSSGCCLTDCGSSTSWHDFGLLNRLSLSRPAVVTTAATDDTWNSRDSL